MNPQIVGKSVETLCSLAGIYGVPKDTSVLVARETSVGMSAVYSHEKLAPILAFFVEKDEDACLKRCVEILRFEGAGHTFAIHCENEALVTRFAMARPGFENPCEYIGILRRCRRDNESFSGADAGLRFGRR